MAQSNSRQTKSEPVDIRGKKYHSVVGRIMMIHEACAQSQLKAVEISVEKMEETELHIDVKATVTKYVELDGSDELTTLKYTDMAREYFEEKQGKRTPVNFAHALENASTSAIGRALRNAGFPGDDELIDDATGEISSVETSISAEEAAGIDRKNKAKASQKPVKSVSSQKRPLSKKKSSKEILINEVRNKRLALGLTDENMKDMVRDLFGNDVDRRVLNTSQLKQLLEEVKNREQQNQIESLIEGTESNNEEEK